MPAQSRIVILIIRPPCLLGQPSEMSGGNIGRSRSLVDIRSLAGSSGLITGAEPLDSLSIFSEEEGLALLTQDSPGDLSHDGHVPDHDGGRRK